MNTKLSISETMYNKPIFHLSSQQLTICSVKKTNNDVHTYIRIKVTYTNFVAHSEPIVHLKITKIAMANKTIVLHSRETN